MAKRKTTKKDLVGVRREIGRICAAFASDSETSFSFAGRDFETATPAVQLQQLLYESCYVRPLNGTPPPTPAAPAPPDADFVRRLVEENRGSERSDQGWQVAGVDAFGRVTASKNGASRVFPPGRYFSPYGPGGSVMPGMTVGVWLAKGSLSLQPGFYHVYSDTLVETSDPRAMLRFYWNVRAASAPRLLGALSGRLNRFQVPFSFKTLTQPEHYDQRSDSSVLYVSRRYFGIVTRLYVELASVLAEDLVDRTPLFTKRLAPGLGFAEDPGNGESFGLNRCRLVAEALWQACERQEHSVEGRLAAVEERFARDALSLDTPYLNPRSTDCYELPSSEGGP
jgi:hypothetical protein